MQSVSMLQNLRVKWKVKGPFLVVAPVSTLAHWKREIESLTDMNCVVYAGSMDDRNIMRDYEFYVSSRIDQFKFNVSSLLLLYIGFLEGSAMGYAKLLLRCFQFHRYFLQDMRF
mgnify:CR=1 FL=1